MQAHIHRNYWVEVNLDYLKNNFQAIRKTVEPAMIMPAVKANAYGHGIVMCCKVLEECGASYLGVGNLDEAILLRRQGIKIPLLIFAGNQLEENVADYIQYNLIPTVFNIRQAKALSSVADREIPIFIKIDTGRGRLGINAEQFPDLFRQIEALPNLKVEGVYSHMLGADWPDENNPERSAYAFWQGQRFAQALDSAGSGAAKIPFLQLANTPACIAYPNLRMTGVCPGRAIWGFSPLEQRPEHPTLRMPMVAVKSRVLHIKEACAGKFGPNGSAVKLEKPIRIGVIAGGVSDGISPAHAKNGYVLIKGKRIPIASAICLEHTILDLSEHPDIQEGDEVVIIGKQGDEEITIAQILAAWNKTLVELWTSFTPHIPRVYLQDEKIVAVTDGDIPIPV